MPRLTETGSFGPPGWEPVVLLSLNVLGAIAYVIGASHGWRIPEEHGEIPVSGEPYAWFAGILPVIAIFLPLNFAWGLGILLRRRWWSGRFWLFSALIWLVAVAIDFAHH